jgi:exodeoxyribonuclease VII small subunit
MNEIKETMKRLDEIINILENNNLGLDLSIKLLEESIVLTKSCTEKLDLIEPMSSLEQNASKHI